MSYLSQAGVLMKAFGGHARIQTWFPFAIQICRSGRNLLAHGMADQR